MSTSYKLPLLNTNLELSSWENQLEKGIKFLFNKNSIFLVCRMTESNVDDVFQLEQKIFPDPWSKAAFQGELQNPEHCLTLVGFIENVLIAYAISRFIIDELHINNIAVAAEYRRKGFGKTLLWLILKIASYSGVNIYHLEVRRSNLAAISLYKKFGFRIVGIRKQYYQKENEDALLMSKFDL